MRASTTESRFMALLAVLTYSILGGNSALNSSLSQQTADGGLNWRRYLISVIGPVALTGPDQGVRTVAQLHFDSVEARLSPMRGVADQVLTVEFFADPANHLLEGM